MEAQRHLERAIQVRSVYTLACETTKRWVRESYTVDGKFTPPPLNADLQGTTDETLHLSFDFAQNACYPADPLQPGPLYFLCERKVHLFGVYCEAIPRQVNYLIDEASYIGKGANTVISLLHHFLLHNSFRSKESLLAR